MRIEQGTRVVLEYELFDGEGQLVESTAEDGPVTYQHGQAEILPGLERGLEGAEAGSTLRIPVVAADAYGAYAPEGIVSVPREQLPEDFGYERGDWITVTVSDDDGEDGDELEMRVVEVHEDEILLDGNHPLAGQDVVFEVRVISVDRVD